MKVLMNAEAFGFGPTAAIASLFPTISNLPFINKLDYVGDNHSLDLQKSLSYDEIFEITNEKEFKELVKNYDVFITALDFEKATWAREVNIHTVIYDTLLWYWRKLPPVIKDCQKYFVQNFFGVEQRIKELNISHYELIPPMIQTRNNLELVDMSEEKFVLINFGGLENPHWSLEITLIYIKKMLNILIPYIKSQGYNYKIACSQGHVKELKEYFVKHYSYKEMQDLLSHASFIYATPGLGNIYECANYRKPCLFLPAANDSQGQQVLILKEKGLINVLFDWTEIANPINYKDPQLVVLDKIEHNIKNFNESLYLNFIKKNTINTEINHQLENLFSQFGKNGKDVLLLQLVYHLKSLHLDKELLYA